MNLCFVMLTYMGPLFACAPNGEIGIMKNVKAEIMGESNIAQGIPLIVLALARGVTKWPCAAIIQV